MVVRPPRQFSKGPSQETGLDILGHELRAEQAASLGHAGRKVEEGPAAALFAQPAHPYTQLLISAVPDPKRTAPFDPVERAQLRRQVLHPTECPWSGKVISLISSPDGAKMYRSGPKTSSLPPTREPSAAKSTAVEKIPIGSRRAAARSLTSRSMIP